MLELNKIYNEDCIGENGMCLISDKSVDMILCDLPYGVTACDWDKQIHIDELWKQYKRIIKDNGAILLFASQPFTTDLINSNRKQFKYCWYWIKNQGTNFFHAKRMPIRKIEEICVFYKKQPTYNMQLSEGHIPTNSAKGCSNGEIYYGTNKRNYEGGSTVRLPTNILEFKCVDNYSKIHPNEKPLELCEYLIKTYSNENETILDNCIGSGTTSIACLNTKRNYIGFEWCPDEPHNTYYDLANKRIEEHKRKINI